MPNQYSDELFKQISQMVSELRKGASIHEKKLYESMMKSIAGAKTDSVSSSVVSVSKLIKEMETSLSTLDSFYAEKMAQQINALSAFQNEQLAYLSPSKAKTSQITNAVATQVAKSLLNGAATQQMRAALNKAILSSAFGGASKDQVIESIGTLIDVGNNETGLPKTIDGLATDALNQYTATYNNAVSSDIGAEWYSYTGSTMETSRCFCKALEDRTFFHISEVPSLLQGKYGNGVRMQCDLGVVEIYEKSGLPQGMYYDTTAGSFFVYRGGYNCGHQILPVSERIVPEPIKLEVYNSPAYKAWVTRNPKGKSAAEAKPKEQRNKPKNLSEKEVEAIDKFTKTIAEKDFNMDDVSDLFDAGHTEVALAFDRISAWESPALSKKQAEAIEYASVPSENVLYGQMPFLNEKQNNGMPYYLELQKGSVVNLVNKTASAYEKSRESMENKGGILVFPKGTKGVQFQSGVYGKGYSVTGKFEVERREGNKIYLKEMPVSEADKVRYDLPVVLDVKTKQQLSEFVKREGLIYGKAAFDKLPNDEVETVASAVAKFTGIVAKYGSQFKTLGYDGAYPKALGYYASGGSRNGEMMLTKGGLEYKRVGQVLRNDRVNDQHPHNVSDPDGRDEFIVYGTLVHEYGHHLDLTAVSGFRSEPGYVRARAKIEDLFMKYKRKYSAPSDDDDLPVLSRYAFTNIKEFIAEGFLALEVYPEFFRGDATLKKAFEDYFEYIRSVSKDDDDE